MKRINSFVDRSAHWRFRCDDGNMIMLMMMRTGNLLSMVRTGGISAIILRLVQAQKSEDVGVQVSGQGCSPVPQISGRIRFGMRARPSQSQIRARSSTVCCDEHKQQSQSVVMNHRQAAVVSYELKDPFPPRRPGCCCFSMKS